MKRMYILILEGVPLGLAINAAAHAAVACTLQYQESSEVKEWLQDSFRKVTCKVTQDELDRATAYENQFIYMTELALDNQITAVAFKPREEYHKMFKYLRLYK